MYLEKLGIHSGLSRQIGTAKEQARHPGVGRDPETQYRSYVTTCNAGSLPHTLLTHKTDLGMQA
jgi:hypothetical protein